MMKYTLAALVLLAGTVPAAAGRGTECEGKLIVLPDRGVLIDDCKIPQRWAARVLKVCPAGSTCWIETDLNDHMRMIKPGYGAHVIYELTKPPVDIGRKQED